MEKENLDIIANLVDKYFSLDSDSFYIFKDYLYNRFIPSAFRNLVDENGRIYIKLKGGFEKDDYGWKVFNDLFKHLDFKISYENFRNNKITINGSTYKLFKYLKKIHKENSSFLSKLKEHYEKHYGTTEDDIDELFKNISELIGTYKFPKGDIYLVISFNYADWFLCSTGEKWSSCLSLESPYLYWAGLPALVTDKNRVLIYLTDKKQKEYLGIKTDRFISRSWGILNKNDEIQIVKSYPIKIHFKDLLVENNFKATDEFSDAKYSFSAIFDMQNEPLFIYMDKGFLELSYGELTYSFEYSGAEVPIDDYSMERYSASDWEEEIDDFNGLPWMIKNNYNLCDFLKGVF